MLPEKSPAVAKPTAYLNALMLMLLKAPDVDEWEAAAIYLSNVSKMSAGGIDVEPMNYVDIYHAACDQLRRHRRIAEKWPDVPQMPNRTTDDACAPTADANRH